MSFKIHVFYVFAFLIWLCDATEIINVTAPVDHDVTSKVAVSNFLSFMNWNLIMSYQLDNFNNLHLQENLIKYCFNDSKKNVIFISNKTMDNSVLLESLYSSRTPTYLFEAGENSMFQTHEQYRNYTINEMHFRRMNNPATSAVIVASSNDTLAMILKEMKDSIWWNHEAFFLIVNGDSDNGCYSAPAFLSTAWAFNILSAIYLCYDSNGEIILYTFNPFTSLAPMFWNKTHNEYSNKDWTLLQHPLESLQTLETLLVHRKYDLLIKINISTLIDPHLNSTYGIYCIF